MLQLKNEIINYSNTSDIISKPKLLLIGGGRPVNADWINSLVNSSNATVWCIDKGIETAKIAGIIPARLIGDGDSSNPVAWQWAENNNVPIEKFSPEKDFTDTQLALDRAKNLMPQPFVILTGCFGGRLDHLFSILFAFGHSHINGIMADQNELVIILRNTIEYKKTSEVTIKLENKPKSISLLPLTATVNGVNISGVHWPLSKASLTQAMPYAISNELEEDEFTVSIDDGILAVYILLHCDESKELK